MSGPPLSPRSSLVDQSAAENRRLPPLVAATAGPACIVAGVLVLLPGFWLGGRLTGQHVDLLAFWLPRWCYLGRNLADLHLPMWLPHQFGGVPFLSDPQSGWLSAPVMVLFTALPCHRALGLYITLQPILAGLGLYGFLRKDGVGRAGATAAGLVVALAMAGSVIALSMPFSSALAWTAITLFGAAGYVRAESAGSRLGWLALAEAGLWHVAASHMSDGLVMAVLLFGGYLVARSVAQVRAGERTGRGAAAQIVLPLLLFPVLAAAVIVPRLALLPRTAVGQGYVELERLAERLSGVDAPSALARSGLGPWWPTGFARGPGGYVGSAAVLLFPIALVSRRWRAQAAGFAAVGFLGWVLTLDALVAWEPLREAVAGSRLGDVWLRDPSRFRLLVLVALAALCGYGLEAWLEWGPTTDLGTVARRAAWLLLPVSVFVLVPVAIGAPAPLYVPFAAGLLVVTPLLFLAAGGSGAAGIALTAVLAVELVLTGLAGRLGPAPSAAQDRFPATADRGLGRAFSALRAPRIDPDRYLTPGPVGRALQAASDRHLRYLTIDPDVARSGPRGFLFHQGPDDWAAYANGRSVLVEADEVLGYSPVQLERYWQVIRRAARRTPQFFNASILAKPDPGVVRLFGVGRVVQRAVLPPPGRGPTRREGRYGLYVIPSPGRVSAVTSWRRVRPGRGLDEVLSARFEHDTFAIVEGGPRPPSAEGRRPASAVYSEDDAGAVRVEVEAASRALVVVRNAWDPNWRATVDGRAATVLVADYVLQGVAVPPGKHVVKLEYRDVPLLAGLALSGAAWAVLLSVLAAAGSGTHRRA